ncbi:MAG: NADP-dependent methylenetetrahydromethanopterin/ methylenetetrahydrofolate dehydrogenase [Thermoleophilia bacterium]
MRKILIQLDNDRFPSVFDAVTAYDAGAEVLLQYGNVQPSDVRDLVYGAMFTRGPADLHNSAVFIGGTDVSAGEAMLQAARDSFFGPLRVSVMLDANGCNTTAAAAVVGILSEGSVEGKKVVVLAGTGPVGQRAAALLAGEGAQVVITSRRLDRAEQTSAALRERFGVQVTAAQAATDEETAQVLEGAHAALSAGAAGVTLLPAAIWKGHPELRILADVNAVPPLGVEGAEVTWAGEDVEGKRAYGAIGIGDFKMKIHKRCLARLFEANDLILDAEEVFALAKELRM